VWRFERFRPDTNYRFSEAESEDVVIAQNNFLICLSAQRPEPAALSNVVLIVATVLIVEPEQSTEALHTDV
jgi:hypothetical protein